MDNHKLNKIAECLETTTDIGKTITKSKHNKDLSYPHEFSLTLFLERFSDNSRSLSILIKSLNIYPNIETSIGLILRSSLLDFLTINYLIIIFETKGEDAYLEELNKLMFDNIARTVKTLKTYWDYGYINKTEYEELILSLKLKYSHYITILKIKDIESISGRKKLLTPIQLFTKIQLNSKYKKNSYAFELYDWYSKYDHFGILSYAFPRSSDTSNLLRIMQSISYLLEGIALVLILLNEQEYSDKLYKLMNDLNNLYLTNQ